MKRGMLDLERIRAALAGRRIGRRVEYLESVSSTNDVAWERLDSPDADGLVVFAEHQTAGRGRFGKKWESPRGAGLLCSVMVVDRARLLRGSEVSLVAPVAAHDAIARTTDIRPRIKWPNDLLVSGKKVGGILVESRELEDGVSAFVVGIGINCLQQAGHFPSRLATSVTSLELETHHPVGRNALAVALLAELDHWLAEPGGWSVEKLREEWLGRAETMGRRVCVRHCGQVFTGSIVDVDPTAALIVQLDEGGIRAFNAADTEIVHGLDAGGG